MPVIRIEARSTSGDGLQAGRRIAALDPAERPDAVSAIGDIIALGVVDALRHEGIRLPGDISVVGFDDIPQAAWPAYALTAVAQPLSAMVRRGLDLLLARMADPDAVDGTVVLGTTLVVR